MASDRLEVLLAGANVIEQVRTALQLLQVVLGGAWHSTGTRVVVAVHGTAAAV